MTRLEEIKARLAAATPGPWKVDEGNWAVERRQNRSFVCGIADIPDSEFQNARSEVDPYKNGEFIANAPSDIEWLIKRVARLEEALKLYADMYKEPWKCRIGDGPEFNYIALAEEGDKPLGSVAKEALAEDES